MRLPLTSLIAVFVSIPALAQTMPPATTPMPTPPAAAPAPAPTNPGASWLEGPIPANVGKIVDAREIPALQNLIQPGTEIRFVGDEYGLSAYFMTNQSQGQVVYVTPDKQALLSGSMFSGDGAAITFMQMLRLRRTGFDPTPFFANSDQPDANAVSTAAPASPTATTAISPTPAPSAAAASPGEQLLTAANNASWLGFGTPTAPTLVSFMDPNCEHCHALFKQLIGLTNQGKLYLRVVPVSVIDPVKSKRDLQNILSHSNPAGAWTAQLNGVAAPTPAAVPPQVEQAIRSNNELFTAWQLGVTPYSVYRAKSGEVKVLAATPKDMNTFLADLGITP